MTKRTIISVSLNDDEMALFLEIKNKFTSVYYTPTNSEIFKMLLRDFQLNEIKNNKR